jgi:SAM-dependent methyltransferase
MASATMSAPLPPAELAAYILGYENTAGVLEAYVEQGEQIAAAIERLLGPGWSWQDKRALDFGCGAARVLRQFLDRAGEAELHGVELDEDCVAWINANLSPPLRVIRSAELPPLPYPDSYFDVIWSTSVFSHLADSWSAWLLELRRLLRPGGIAVVSVMGAACSQAIACEEWDPNRIGMVTLGYGRPWRAGGPMILHAEWWIRAHWGRAFTIEAFEERGIEGQDAVVLRRDERPVPSVAELDAPEPNEPRELAAAQHAIELLHREHATLNRQHDEYARAYLIEARNHAATTARVVALETELQDVRGRGTRGLAQHAITNLRRRLSA